MTDRPVVEFFYCFSCPWTYLAFVRLQEAAMRAGAAIAFRPIVNAWLPRSAQDIFNSLRRPADPDGPPTRPRLPTPPRTCGTGRGSAE